MSSSASATIGVPNAALSTCKTTNLRLAGVGYSVSGDRLVLRVSEYGQGEDLNGDGYIALCTGYRQCGVIHLGAIKALPRFLRGDSNSDAEIDLSDAVYTLTWLFRQGPAPSCQDTADANDDSRLNITDPVYTLLSLCRGDPPLPPPGPETCGPDFTEDTLTCGSYPRCEE